MLAKELKDKLMDLLECCSDSDIEDFIDENSLTRDEAREVWEIVSIHNAPDCCKDCSFVTHFPQIHPCDRCIRPRQNLYKDYFKKKQYS